MHPGPSPWGWPPWKSKVLPRRATLHPDVIDFEAVTHAPDNVHLFIDGLDEDGIHPSAAGHRVMADEVVRVLRANGVPPLESP